MSRIVAGHGKGGHEILHHMHVVVWSESEHTGPVGFAIVNLTVAHALGPTDLHS